MQANKLLYGLCIFAVSAIFSCNKEELRSTVDPTLPPEPDPAPNTVVDTSAPTLRQTLGVYKGTWRRYSKDNHNTPEYNYDETSESLLEIKRVSRDTLMLVVDGVERSRLIYHNVHTYRYPLIDQLYLTVTFGGDSVYYEYKNSEMSGSHSWRHDWGQIGRWKR